MMRRLKTMKDFEVQVQLQRLVGCYREEGDYPHLGLLPRLWVKYVWNSRGAWRPQYCCRHSSTNPLAEYRRPEEVLRRED